MRLFSRIKDLCIDFVFPKSRAVAEFESFSTAEVLELLPKAARMESKEDFALFDYDYPLLKEMIWELKYGGNKKIAEIFGAILCDVATQDLMESGLLEKWRHPILVPVPISAARRFERGWNQSELLAEAMMKNGGEHLFRYVPEVLAKIRHTESQTKTSSKNERLENLKGSMEVVHGKTFSGECVLVVDDVTTTGATFAEVRRALKAAGAGKILCFAVAH